MSTSDQHGTGTNTAARCSRLGVHPETVITDSSGTMVVIDARSGQLAVGVAGLLSALALDDVTDVTLRPGNVFTAVKLDFTTGAGPPLTLHFTDRQQARLAQLRIAIALVHRYRRA